MPKDRSIPIPVSVEDIGAISADLEELAVRQYEMMAKKMEYLLDIAKGSRLPLPNSGGKP